jgi:hypothetical protein
MIGIESSGSFKNTDAFLRRMAGTTLPSSIERFAQAGVDRLKAATPQDEGDTANGWYYEIDVKGAGNGGTTTIWWCNSHQVDGFNVAVGLQYGHGTGNGGYVAPIDYINPALKPIFDQLAEMSWKEVQNA